MPSVLDEENKEQSASSNIRPDFLPDGSHDALEMSDDDRQSETNALEDGFYRTEENPADIRGAESTGKTSGDTPTKSDKSEIQKLDDSLYKTEGGGGLLSRIKGANKRRKIIAAATGSSIAGLVIGGFFMLPLKVMHVTENLQSTFFSSSEEAAEGMTNNLLSSYLIYKVIPGLNGSCTSTKVDKSCAVVNDDDNYVSQLYRAWRDNNLEGKMASKHGLEIKRVGNTIVFRSDRLQQDIFRGDYEPGKQQEFERKMFTALNRSEVRREMLRSIENETFYKRIMYRYKYGSLMERKYGIIRCVVACEYRQDKADNRELRKMKYKAWVIHRVVGPLNEGYALAFQCAVSNFDCAKESDAEVDEDGAKKTKFENDLRAKTKEVIGDGRMTKERLAQMQSNADDIRNNGMANHLLKSVFGEAGGKIAGGSVAGAGLIDVLAKFVDGITNAGTAIKSMNYALKTGAAVQVYSMYRTNADEVKPGTLNIEELGYVSESLGDSYGEDQGGGGAEASPYYNEVMGSQGVNTASMSLFPKASAAAPYKCDDGTSIASGLCPEMSMAATTSGADTISSLGSFFEDSGLGALAGAWNATIGKAFDAAANVIGFILDPIGDIAGNLTPGFIKDKAADIAKSIGKWFTEKLFVNFMTNDPSGGRMFEAAAVGANVAANDYAHYGLGAGKISDQAANEIRYARALERQQEFAKQPFLARMFDTSSSFSMVSRLALASPSGSNINSSLASTLLSPIKMVSSSIPSLTRAGAAPKENLDLAGVTQYGYTGNEDIFKTTTDLEAYWDNNKCDDSEQVDAWGQTAQVSSVNGSFENNTPYPCKLLDSVVSMNGAYYSDQFLDSDELGQESESNGVNETGPGANIVVATYNLPSKKGFDEGDWSKAVRLIRERNMDVIGFQEISGKEGKNSFGYLRNQLSNYGSYPHWRIGANYCANSQPIFYNKDKFDLVKSELLVYPRYNNNETNCGEGGQIKKGESQAPIIWLTTKENNGKPGGQTVIFMNTHNAASGGFGDTSSAEAALNRYKASLIYTQKVEQLRKDNPGVPIIFTGDFNEGTGVRDRGNITYERKQSNLFFCMITSKKLMRISEDPGKDCSGRNTIGGVDYIYATTEVKVNWNRVVKGRAISGSDHHRTPIYANLIIPTSDVSAGVGGGASAGSVTMGDDYKSEWQKFGAAGTRQCVDFVKFRLKKHIDRNKFATLGDGKDVAANLGKMGYKVNNTPAVNSVVSWPAGGVPGSGANERYGHTAMVSKVEPGKYIVVEEYNYATPLGYGIRKISWSAATKLTYAHTEVDFK